MTHYYLTAPTQKWLAENALFQCSNDEQSGELSEELFLPASEFKLFNGKPICAECYQNVDDGRNDGFLEYSNLEDFRPFDPKPIHDIATKAHFTCEHESCSSGSCWPHTHFRLWDGKIICETCFEFEVYEAEADGKAFDELEAFDPFAINRRAAS